MDVKNKNRIGYKKTKVGWIPADWKCVPFTSIFNRIVVPLTPNLSKMYQEIGVRSHGKGIFHKQPVTGTIIGGKRVFYCQPGALVFNIVFAWEQAVAVISERENGLIASHRFPMYRGHRNQAFEPFFLLFFKTRRGKYGLTVSSPGGAGRNKTLGQKELEILFVPKPDLDEQEAIAKVLECWDKAIRNYEKKIEKKRNIKRGLMQRLLSGKHRLPGFSGKWKEVRLEEIVSMAYGKDWKGVACENGDYIVYGTGGAIGKSSEFLFNAPAIILGRKGTIDAPFYLDEPFWAVDTTFAIHSIGNVDLEFLYNKFLTIPWEQFNEASGVPSLSRTTIMRIKLTLPSIEEQKTIASVFSAADSEIEAMVKKLVLLKDQKKFLLNNLVTGSLRLPEFRIVNCE